MVGRLSQALVDTNKARVQLYIDDPIVTIAEESQEEADDTTAMLLLFWQTLGLGLATHKAQSGSEVTWTGFQCKTIFNHELKRASQASY